MSKPFHGTAAPTQRARSSARLVATGFWLAVTGAASTATIAHAAEQPAPLTAESATVVRMPPIGPHTLFINDPNFLGYMDSKIVVVDADTDTMLGMLSTGGWRMTFEFAADGKHVFVPETYYERVSRGTKTEVVSIYDLEDLTFVREVVIPPIRATGAAQRGYSGVTDDGRFMVIANQTPAMSVTVVDMQNFEVTGESSTPGCIIVMPTGPRSFALLCGTGNLMHVRLDESGAVEEQTRTDIFFDAAADPVSERAVRVGDDWYLFTFSGRVFRATHADGELTVSRAGTLDDSGTWRPGGAHYSAATNGRVYLIMNDAGPGGHKDAGNQVWVFDTMPWRRVARYQLEEPATQIAASQDDDPILVLGGEGPAMVVLSAATGATLRHIEGPLLGPGILQFPPRGTGAQ